MADSQISTVLIPCFVIQMNNEQFISDNGVIGRVDNVPCRASNVDQILYWCSPISDAGIFTGVQFRLATGDNLAQPTYNSFYVQRIRDKVGLNKNNTWWVYVNTNNDFKNSCNTCCGAAAIPMPGVSGNFNPVFPPCQTLCAENNSDQLEGVFGIPTLPAGDGYYPYGSYDNVQLPQAPTSYATLEALLTFLNTNWTNHGSPNTTFVWSVSGDGLTLIALGGIAGHELCVQISAISPSP